MRYCEVSLYIQIMVSDRVCRIALYIVLTVTGVSCSTPNKGEKVPSYRHPTHHPDVELAKDVISKAAVSKVLYRLEKVGANPNGVPYPGEYESAFVEALIYDRTELMKVLLESPNFHGEDLLKPSVIDNITPMDKVVRYAGPEMRIIIKNYLAHNIQLDMANHHFSTVSGTKSVAENERRRAMDREKRLAERAARAEKRRRTNLRKQRMNPTPNAHRHHTSSDIMYHAVGGRCPSCEKVAEKAFKVLADIDYRLGIMDLLDREETDIDEKLRLLDLLKREQTEGAGAESENKSQKHSKAKRRN